MMIDLKSSVLYVLVDWRLSVAFFRADLRCSAAMGMMAMATTTQHTSGNTQVAASDI